MPYSHCKISVSAENREMAEKETENSEVLSSQFFNLAFSVLATQHSLHCAINTTGDTILLKSSKVPWIYGWASAEPSTACQLPGGFAPEKWAVSAENT